MRGRLLQEVKWILTFLLHINLIFSQSLLLDCFLKSLHQLIIYFQTLKISPLQLVTCFKILLKLTQECFKTQFYSRTHQIKDNRFQLLRFKQPYLENSHLSLYHLEVTYNLNQIAFSENQLNLIN